MCVCEWSRTGISDRSMVYTTVQCMMGTYICIPVYMKEAESDQLPSWGKGGRLSQVGTRHLFHGKGTFQKAALTFLRRDAIWGITISSEVQNWKPKK